VSGPLRLAGPYGDAARLELFRRAHPEVVIRPGEFGTWEACIPEAAGKTIVVRHTLRELLDKLDALMTGAGESR